MSSSNSLSILQSGETNTSIYKVTYNEGLLIKNTHQSYAVHHYESFSIYKVDRQLQFYLHYDTWIYSTTVQPFSFFGFWTASENHTQMNKHFKNKNLDKTIY